MKALTYDELVDQNSKLRDRVKTLSSALEDSKVTIIKLTRKIEARELASKN